METDKPYNGTFSPADLSGSGHLIVAGKDSSLKLVTDDDIPLTSSEYEDIHGVLDDGRKASALQCIWHGSTEPRLRERRRRVSNYFPHYVIFGETYVNTDDAIINAVHYSFENAHCLVSGHRTFQSLHPTPEEARGVLEAEYRRHSEIAKTHGWGEHPFDPEIGEHPHLLYYSGVWDVANAAAELGTVSLHNRPTISMGSSQGVWIKNQVSVAFRFHEPKTLPDVTHALSRLHKLFELALGRRERLLRIELETTHAKKETADAPAFPWHQLHWSYCNEDITGETPATSIANVLLNPEQRPDEFAAVISGWLNSGLAMGEARNRFATAFFRGGYDIDRIVGAANMFDLLPEDRAPKAREIDPETKEAVDKCRALFEGLPHDFARQSVLSALGRVGRASLRDKVLHRAKIVQSAAGAKFADIEIPCSQAVLCRNHFVHGSDAEFDYRENFGAFAFLTNTLEFVFAISDLVDLGWSFQTWREHGFAMGDDELSDYVINYESNLARLKALIPAKKLTSAPSPIAS